MKRQCLYFMGPRQVCLREELLAEPGPGQVLVETAFSAISPGTELLIYRGEFPAGLALDENLPALSEDFSFPLKYGYAAAGRVAALGEGVGSGPRAAGDMSPTRTEPNVIIPIRSESL